MAFAFDPKRKPILIGAGDKSGISEKRSDLLLSTLRKTIKAMGGDLSLVAEFRARPPGILSGIAGDDPLPKPTGRTR